jgi:hypothetical protein
MAGDRGGCEDAGVALAEDPVRRALLRRGFWLEYATLAWNVIEIVVLAIAAVSARSQPVKHGPAGRWTTLFCGPRAGSRRSTGSWLPQCCWVWC